MSTIVKFLKSWRGYNAGEIAGFDADTAEALLRGKVAEEHDASTEQRTTRTQSTRAPRKKDGQAANATTGGADAGGEGGDTTSTPPGADAAPPQGTDASQQGGPTDNDDRP